MRHLYIMQGLPGSGKSTVIKNNGLEPYTISPDSIRLLFSSLVLNTDGDLKMPLQNDAEVWKLMYEKLEDRMRVGELIVVDATHTQKSYFENYARLAKKYRYKAYVVDLTDVSLDICKVRNKNRETYKVVPDVVLDRMHRQLEGCRVPSFFKVISSTEISETLVNEYTNLSKYKVIHHIGDIQGCYEPLNKYFELHPYKPRDFYIFTGDLLDRGPDNDKVLSYILENFLDKPNVVFICGNHDEHLWNWLTKQPIKSQEFINRTQPQLENANIDRRDVSTLFQKMQDVLLYTHQEKTVLVTHGGLPTFANLKFIPSSQLIRGVGKYEEVNLIDDNFSNIHTKNAYQIHGHRNAQNFPTQYNSQCFNLEGKVEFGGHLRVVQLLSTGFKIVEIENTQDVKQFPENAPLIHKLQTNRLVQEKILPDNLVSYNFKREVFYNRLWNSQTVKARGLFINKLTNEIVARAYDKFFHIGERPETELEVLKDSLTFPLTISDKENGYLGLLGYDSLSNSLVFTSKSTTESEFAKWFKELFIAKHGKHLENIKQFLKDENCCFVFEVVLPKKDPHIIEYHEDKLVLLDIVKRTRDFERLIPLRRQSVCVAFGFNNKIETYSIQTWDAFIDFIESTKDDMKKDWSDHIEGFVIEDSNNFHLKIKLDWYSTWKELRSVLDTIKQGKPVKYKPHWGSNTNFYKEVIEFMQSIDINTLNGMNIIEVRNKFLREK